MSTLPSVFRHVFGIGFRRLLSSLYSYTLLTVLILQAIFIYFVEKHKIPFQGFDFTVDDVQTGFFLCAVHLLLFVNTIIFLNHVTPIVAPVQLLKDLPDDTRSDIKGAYRVFTSFLVISVVISAFVFAMVLLILCRVIPSIRWKWVISSSEIMSFLVFALFVTADWFCLYIGLKILQQPTNVIADRDKITKLVDTTKRYILAVDVPGVIGLGLIIVCSHIFYPEFIQVSYWEGFVAGAVGLHIMFSQAALAFLSVLEDD